ncbi:SulP family inorganic anion transporter [Microlunatus soli]|uniref:Sulfate permease, SulP family n=2 Tax=Microlunatus soli TaxID=630515 RepID=A0A1H1Q549_9ACTN|nr:SulP family inorganic anion transporter [Microlunatus soli]SDS18387.1 sulfate permease, SulP family [Microlunatus soli]
MSTTGPDASTPAPDSLPDSGDPYTVRAAFGSLRRMRIEVLGGLVVALALIPEAISFSIIAGVDPRVGLFASFTMAVTISIVGGRRAMISAATGSVALVIGPLTREHGIDYLIVTVLLAGVIQIVLALLGVAKLMRFIPRSVMIGFVNALAILIFIAQLPHLIGVPWLVYPLVAAGIVIIIGFPRLTTVVPAPLIAILVISVLVIATGLDIPNVGDEGKLPDSLPTLFLPDVPLSWETLRIVGPYAFGMALVALLESLMTAKLVDDVTDTHSNKTREALGQGVANVVTGLFGGMGGCAMIGQTMINVKQSGSRTRISTFLAGVFLLILVVALNDIVAVIPMAALVAVMIMVSVGTFDWHSIHPRTLRRMPISATVIMLCTVVPTVLTNNLAVGVIIGVVVAALFFVARVAHFTEVVDVAHPDDETRVYAVRGLLFFASSNDLVYQFDYTGDPPNVIIDLSQSQIYDSSTVATLDAIEQKYREKGKNVEITGLNEPSLRWHSRLTGTLGGGN